MYNPQDQTEWGNFKKVWQLTILTRPEAHRESMGYYQEENEKQETKKNADEVKATVKETWASYHLSSATNWSPQCHAKLRQELKQKKPLPSIEYIYSKWTYFPEGQQFTFFVFIDLMKYSNLLRSWIGGFLLNVRQNHQN